MDALQRLVAQVNASAFFVDDNTPAPTRRKKHRLTKKVEELPLAHRDALIRMLEGSAVMLSCSGVQFVAWRNEGCWVVLGLYEEAEGPHTVVDGKCSCPQAKFRDPNCKHLQALRGAKL